MGKKIKIGISGFWAFIAMSIFFEIKVFYLLMYSSIILNWNHYHPAENTFNPLFDWRLMEISIFLVLLIPQIVVLNLMIHFVYRLKKKVHIKQLLNRYAAVVIFSLLLFLCMTSFQYILNFIFLPSTVLFGILSDPIKVLVPSTYKLLGGNSIIASYLLTEVLAIYIVYKTVDKNFLERLDFTMQKPFGSYLFLTIILQIIIIPLVVAITALFSSCRDIKNQFDFQLQKRNPFVKISCYDGSIADPTNYKDCRVCPLIKENDAEDVQCG